MRFLKLFLIFLVLFSCPVYSWGESFGKDNYDVEQLATPYLDNVLMGMKMKDYEVYTKDFDKLLKASITEDQFNEVVEVIESELGNYQEREYLGFLNQENMTLILWKGRFDGTKDDILMKFLMSKRDNKYIVMGLWFQ